jgi:hypothetical protein
MKRIWFCAMTLCLVVPLGRIHGDDEGKSRKAKDEDNPLVELMLQKLTASQDVLRGIALGDFALIEKNAARLRAISAKAEWQVMKTPTYDLYSNEFQRSAENLGQSAKKKNLDAAALAYVEMTLNCVRCHKYVREVRMTRLEGPARNLVSSRSTGD